MKKELINDTDYAKALNEMGFCVAPLFTLQQIEQLQALYNDFSINSKVSGLIASHSKTPAEQSLEISNSIHRILAPSLQQWFSGFKFFLGGFMVKEANTEKEFPLHQDWNITDESRYTTYQIWIPLELSSPYNGGIFVLPGSHRFFQNNRSGSYGMPRVDTDDALRELSVDMIIPPASALVYHNSLFHASYPNRTNQNRASVIINVYQEDAVLEYAHKNSANNTTEKYAIDTVSFLSNLNTFEQGKVPAAFNISSTCEADDFNNASVNSNDLIQGFNRIFPYGKAGFEPMQLSILNDKNIADKMKRDGYAVIDFIDNATAQDLKAAYEKEFGTHKTPQGRFTTLENVTPEKRRYFHQLLLEKLNERINFFFYNYEIPIASYFVKYARSAGDLNWHQDSSLLLNAHLEPHYALWCPLLDVDESNGALCVIDKSHKNTARIIVHDLPWPYTASNEYFDKHKTVLNLKAGQAVLFDIRLIHHATKNNSNDDRVCFTFRITHQKSKYYRMVCDNAHNENVSIYEQPHNYYLTDEWNTGAQPIAGSKRGELQHIHSNINQTIFDEAVV